MHTVSLLYIWTSLKSETPGRDVKQRYFTHADLSALSYSHFINQTQRSLEEIGSSDRALNFVEKKLVKKKKGLS